MWHEGLLYRTNATIIAGVLCLAMVGAAWSGYRLALAERRTGEASAESLSEIGPVEGAVAGLLALVLAFSFTMAADRFDARQATIVSQANAIEKAYARCSVLQADDRARCESDLRAYVDLFVDYGDVTRDDKKIESIVRQAEQIERSLWERVSAVAREHPTPVNAELIASINDVGDRRGERIASMRIVVPEEVTAILLFLCVVWAGIAGYAYGLKRNHRTTAWVAFSVLVAVVVYVTLDYDRPRRGILRLDAGLQSMIDLQTAMHEAAAPLAY